MDIISLHMNAAQRDANLHPGADLHLGVFYTWPGCKYGTYTAVVFHVAF